MSTSKQSPAETDPLQAALAEHKAGRWDAAERGYRALLTRQPDHVAAQHYLGVLRAERGDPADGSAWLARAAGQAPDDPNIRADLAGVRRRAGDPAGARQAADAALARQPGLAVARYNRALAALDAGDAATAAADLDALLAERPNDAGLLYERGKASLAADEPATAVAVLAQAHRLAPEAGEPGLLLARAHIDNGDPAAGLAVLDALPESLGKPAEWHHQRGRARLLQDAPANAEAPLRRASELAPNTARYLNELAGCLHQQDRKADAAATYRAALAALDAAGGPPAWRALILRNLADSCYQAGDWQAAKEAAEAAFALAPLRRDLHSDLLLWRQYDPQETPESIYRATLDWARRHAAPVEAHAVAPAPGPADKRPLTVGVLSNKLRRHPQLWLYLPAFEHLDPAEIRVVVYHAGEAADDFTQRLYACAAAWHDVAAWDDAAIAHQMRRDGLDILLNKAGHAEGRLLACARRPAPVQVQWGGFGTTGMASMDWFLADWTACPPGSEGLYTERLYRLPDDYVVYTPPDDAPEIGPLPAAQCGTVTFGCLNTPAKLNAPTAALWRQVLDAVPGSTLLVRNSVADTVKDSPQLKRDLAAWGLPAERIELAGSRPHGALLGLYNRIDIALDPWPYSGGLTTIEALWMGVPVVTLPGRSFVSRHAATHLATAGLADWIARDGADYVAIARRWAADPGALAALRAGLRRRVRASPLCDGPGFARHLTAALRDIHRRAAGAP